MSKYLKNMKENLEILDLVWRKKVSMFSLLKLEDKQTAICNLTKLKEKLPSGGYNYAENDQVQAVSDRLLSDERVCLVLNSLQSWNAEMIKLFGGYLMHGWDYQPQVLSDCLKELQHRNKLPDAGYNFYGSSSMVSPYALRCLHEMKASGHNRLWMLFLDSASGLKTVVEKNILAGNGLISDEKLDAAYGAFLGKFKVLEQLPDDFKLDDEASRICSLPELIAQPGALEIYQAASGFCDCIRLEEKRDYSGIPKILLETMKKIQAKCPDESGAETRCYLGKASYVKFDQKLLKGFCQHMDELETETFGNAVATRSGFLAVCTGNRYTPLVQKVQSAAGYHDPMMDLIQYCIIHHKKSFLRLIEEKLELFLQMPNNSILYLGSFWSLCNLNTLQEKDIQTLLKKDEKGAFLYSQRNASLKCLKGSYTFQELALLSIQCDWIRNIYSQLNPALRVDEKMRRIRQLLHSSKLKLIYLDAEASANALSRESLEDYEKRRNIAGISRSELFKLMVLEETDKRISALVDEAHDSRDIEIILRNKERPELFELGLYGFKKSFVSLDADSRWLSEQMAVPAEHAENFKQFCLNGNAAITHDYYKGLSFSQNQQKENIILLAKASVYDMLDTVKYQNFQSEIGYPVSENMEKKWRENLCMSEGRLKTAEYTDFQSCMAIGSKPSRTCMNYVDGMYNECLLATFDANKKVLYVSEDGQVIARALLRLTKTSDAANAKVASSLHFADVGETETTAEEHPVLFLERCYKNGYTGGKANLICQRLFELAKKKADIMGMPLVLADDYSWVAEQNRYVRTQSNIYVSRSKNGKQYLDSLGGNCEKGGYYVSGSFYFAS